MAKSQKTLDTLVEDIYNKIGVLADGEHIDLDKDTIEQFGESMKEILYNWSHPEPRGKPTLRMSNIGRKERQLWFDMKTEGTPERMPPSLFIKFLYGHLLEEIVLFLIKLSGHTVTNEQKEIKVSGIKGHMDCVIDGEVVDIKTASGYAFKKFKDGTLAENDMFGYMAQLAGYEEAEGTNNGGFLALNKESGELALYKPDEFDKPNIKKKIKDIKAAIKLDKPPNLCYNPVPDGKSGNMQLARECVYCRHKFECHKDSNEGKGLRVFKYSNGLRYLTQAPKPPKVIEVTQL
jgi:hypothetical protein|tara:strand:+ start:652 stop:1524 length:873 start_codon:yes stop_codon:yes gene_type:complete